MLSSMQTPCASSKFQGLCYTLRLKYALHCHMLRLTCKATRGYLLSCYYRPRVSAIHGH